MGDYQNADNYLYDQATSSEQPQNISRSKTVVSVTDINQGSYQSGIINIDVASQLRGSKGFASLRDSYIVLPYVVSLQNTGSTALNGQVNRFCTGLKAGVWNVIDSLAVELDGKSIITENDYKLYWNNIRAQTEWSDSDVKKNGADSFVAPDDWNSMSFTFTAQPSGDGFVNNFTNEVAPAGVVPESTQLGKNDGFVKRVYCNPQPTAINGTTSGFTPYNWITQRSGVSTNIAVQNGKGVFTSTATGTGAPPGATAAVWYHMLKIRLVDLHPLFKELDLMANPSLKLRLRVNSGFSDISVVGGTAGLATMALSGTTMTSGNTVPVMIASAAANNAMAGVLPLSGTTTLRLAFGPLQNTVTNFSTASQYFPFPTSRLMVPFYDITNPSAIVSKPVKTIRFQDCYAQYYTRQAGVGTSTSQLNAPFALQLSASQKNIKQVILIPFSETSSGHYSVASNVEQFRSPFDSAPWTCQPGSAIRSFQVQVGSQTIFTRSIDHDYEMFNDEFRKLGAINGGMTHELGNGLIDLQKYSTIHRYMVADCSRVTDKDVPQSVVVSGVNAACQGANLLILIVYEREMSYDRLTGEVQLHD